MVDARAQAVNVARNLRYRGADAVREFAARIRYSVQSTTDPDPVLDADWDVLVLLDACRADLFAEVAAGAGYDFLPDSVAGTRVSPASASKQWLRTVFGGAEDGQLAGLAYVSGNPFTASEVDASRFHTVDEVWRYAWDDDLGTIPPRPITDAAVRTWRDGGADRLVVHYMQPHFPSLVDSKPPRGPDASRGEEHQSSDRSSERSLRADGDEPCDCENGSGVELSEFGDREMSVWDDLRFGRRGEDDAWQSYRTNLERVLDELDVLLSNLDANRVVVTADHGNAFGEHGLYGHPSGVDLPCLREVPWCVTSATDAHSHEPVDRDAVGQDSVDGETIIEDRLEDLGYRT